MPRHERRWFLLRSVVHRRADRWSQRRLLCLWRVHRWTLPGGQPHLCSRSHSGKETSIATQRPICPPPIPQDVLSSFFSLSQMLFFNMPLTAYLCWSVHHRYRGHTFRSHFRKPYCSWASVAVHLVMMLLLIWQAQSCHFLLETYGFMSFLMSPVRTWALGLGLLLVYRAWTGPSPHFRESRKSVAPS